MVKNHKKTFGSTGATFSYVSDSIKTAAVFILLPFMPLAAVGSIITSRANWSKCCETFADFVLLLMPLAAVGRKVTSRAMWSNCCETAAVGAV